MCRIIIATLAICLIGTAFGQLSEAEIVEDGLVGYWGFDQIVGGSKVEDGVADRDGTIRNGNLQSVDGKIGKALEFDGSGAYVEISDPNAFIANADFTWCAWIKTGEDGGGIIAKTLTEPNSDAQGAKTFYVQGGTLTFDTGWVGQMEGIEPINDDNWHYVSVTAKFNGANATLQFYVDGEADAQGPMAVGQFPEDDFPILIGLDPRVIADAEGISVPFTGIIDEVAIYDRVLTEDEIGQNFQSGVGLSVEASGKLAVTWGDLKRE